MGHLLVLCGTPCTGKSTLGEWLQAHHAWLFINHDFRRLEATEPHEEAAWWRGIYAGSILEFISVVEAGERDVVVEFGFPIHLLPLVDQLHAAGVELWWFRGDRFLARELFLKRNDDWIRSGKRAPIQIEAFENTIAFQRAHWNRIRPLFRHRILECLSPGLQRPTPEAQFRQIAAAAGWQLKP